MATETDDIFDENDRVDDIFDAEDIVSTPEVLGSGAPVLDAPVDLTAFDTFTDVGPQPEVPIKVPFARPETYKEDGLKGWLMSRLMSKKPFEGAAAGAITALTGGIIPAGSISKVPAATVEALDSSTLGDALQGFGQGASYGFSDELEGAYRALAANPVAANFAGPVGSMIHPAINLFSDTPEETAKNLTGLDGSKSLIENYKTARNEARDRQLAEKDQKTGSPMAYSIGELLGAFMAPGPKMGKVGAPGMTWPRALGQGAASGLRSGTLQGAAYGAGTSDADNVTKGLTDVVSGTLPGAIAGGALGALTGVGGQLLRLAGARRALGSVGRATRSDRDALLAPIREVKEQLSNPSSGPNTLEEMLEGVLPKYDIPKTSDADILKIGEGLIERDVIGPRGAGANAARVRQGASDIVNDLGFSQDDVARMVERSRREAAADAAALKYENLRRQNTEKLKSVNDKNASDMRMYDESVEAAQQELSSAENRLSEAQDAYDRVVDEQAMLDLLNSKKSQGSMDRLQELLGDQRPFIAKRSTSPNFLAETSRANRDSVQKAIEEQYKPSLTAAKEALDRGKTEANTSLQNVLADAATKEQALLKGPLEVGSEHVSSPMDKLVNRLLGKSGPKPAAKSSPVLEPFWLGDFSPLVGVSKSAANPKTYLTYPPLQGGLAQLGLLAGKNAQELRPALTAMQNDTVRGEMGTASQRLNDRLMSLYDRLMSKPKTPEQMKEEETRQNANSQQHFIKGNGG